MAVKRGRGRRLSYGKRNHDVGEVRRQHDGLASYCDHRGIGLPGCPVCDPKARDSEEAA
jgi:hypothetical protein